MYMYIVSSFSLSKLKILARKWQTVTHSVLSTICRHFHGLFWNENRQDGNDQNYWNMKQKWTKDSPRAFLTGLVGRIKIFLQMHCYFGHPLCYY